MNIILVFSFLVLLVLIGLYGSKRPMVLHYILILLYTFYNPITNKIIFLQLTLWALFLLLRGYPMIRNKYLALIFLIGSYWLLAGIRGISLSTSMKSEDIASFLLSPYFNGVVWAIIIGNTLKNLEDVKKFFAAYATMRLIEIGLFGMFLYFFQYDRLLEWQILLKEFMRLDVDPTKRLISLASRNANEAAFLLLGVGGVVFSRFYEKMSIKNIFWLLVLVAALLLTWTRSGWLMFIFLIMLFFMITGRIKKRFIYMAIPIFFIGMVPLVLAIVARAGEESRLLSDETISLRFQLYYQYLRSIPRLPMFYGIYEDIWITCDRLGISQYISSENIFIDTFVKHGILAGVLYLFVWMVFIYLYGKITLTILHIRERMPAGDFMFIASLAATFYAVFIMANTSLFEQTSFFWIMFGLSVPVYNHLKIKLSGENSV